MIIPRDLNQNQDFIGLGTFSKRESLPRRAYNLNRQDWQRVAKGDGVTLILQIEGTQVQRECMTCTRSHRKSVAAQRIEPRPPKSQSSSLTMKPFFPSNVWNFLVFPSPSEIYTMASISDLDRKPYFQNSQEFLVVWVFRSVKWLLSSRSYHGFRAIWKLSTKLMCSSPSTPTANER